VQINRVALFVEEAHDLCGKTLIGLKHLMEVITDSEDMLSVVPLGHPKLRIELRRLTIEEIAYRPVVFEFEDVAGRQADCIRWVLGQCAGMVPKSPIWLTRTPRTPSICWLRARRRLCRLSSICGLLLMKRTELTR
jgi:type II secretory pathway predicted ATPase ExeA